MVRGDDAYIHAAFGGQLDGGLQLFVQNEVRGHDINIPVIKYNDENSLACVITLVYLSARTKYTIVREMEAGAGKADFIFYPNDKSKPAFILELKKNASPEEALKQIREKRYATALRDYTGQKLAVGISYDEKLKKHSVKIEEI